MKQKVYYVAWLEFSRIHKLCDSKQAAEKYEQELKDKGLNIKASEVFPAECAEVRMDLSTEGVTVH